MTHTHCSIRDTQPVVCGARLGQFTLSLDLVFCAAISRVLFAFQSPRADRRFGPIAGFSFSARMALEKLGETTRFTRRQEQTSPRALTAQGDLRGNGTRETGRRKRA